MRLKTEAMRKTVFSLLGYIGCIAMSVFVTFAINGTIGIVLTYALVTGFLVSLLMTVAVLRKISVFPSFDRSSASKGDTVLFEIGLKNRSFLPVPLIEAEVESSAHFSLTGERMLLASVTGKGSNTLKFPMTAVHSGKAHIRIKSIRLSDYLGIFSFRIPFENDRQTVAVYPDIPDLSAAAGITKQNIRFSDNDEEEESDETSSVFTGLAGYDHREYMPGDPLKRVNWKLSSKRDILMVRLDEKIRGAGYVFLLDCPVTEETEETLTVKDNVVEGALAILCSLIADGRNVTFCFCKQGLLLSMEIKSLPDIFVLQQELSDYEPCNTAEVLLSQKSAIQKQPVCFTAATGENYSSVESIAAKYPTMTIIYSGRVFLPAVTTDMWTLSDSFEPEKR